MTYPNTQLFIQGEWREAKAGDQNQNKNYQAPTWAWLLGKSPSSGDQIIHEAKIKPPRIIETVLSGIC